MGATDELRRLLDERGVEYVSIGGITNWEHAEFDELADGSDTRLIVLGATPEQAIAATVGTEPDEQDMLKLHDRMNAALLDMQEELLAYHPQDRENASSKKLIDCVIAAHQIIEDAATVGRGNLTAEQVREAIERHSAWVIGNNRCFHDGAYEEIADELNATVGRRDTMGLWPEWEQVLFANVSDEVAQDNLNECVHELLDKAATVGVGTCHYIPDDAGFTWWDENDMEHYEEYSASDECCSASCDKCGNQMMVGDDGWFNGWDEITEWWEEDGSYHKGYVLEPRFKYCPNCGKRIVKEEAE